MSYAPERGGQTNALRKHTIRLQFDTPDLATGVPFFTPADPGEVIVPFGWSSVVEAWDVADAKFTVFMEGDDPVIDGYLASEAVTSADFASGTFSQFSDAPVPEAALRLNTLTPVLVRVTDNADAPVVGATVGVCELTIFSILPADFDQ